MNGLGTAKISAPLPVVDFPRRVEAIRTRLDESAFDALLITNMVEVRWLTGFGGSNGWVSLRSDELLIGTDGRYAERAVAESAGTGATVVAEQVRSRLHDRLLESLRGAKSVALDPTSLSHSEWSTLSNDLALCPTPSVVAGERQVKDEAELARIEVAAAAADAALGDVEPMLFATMDHSVTEADIRNELEYRMRLYGADDRSYETIVASGPENAARPHHDVCHRPIVDGDTVIIDVGALVDGYHSDMTRSYVIGQPTSEQRAIYDLVVSSQLAGIDALQPGVTAKEVDSACRDVFEDAGYGSWFLHGAGHGVGLEIHELPFHSQASNDVIEAGHVVTIEPGLYRGGFGGFRIEDLLVVTEHGSRVLTHTPQGPFPGSN